MPKSAKKAKKGKAAKKGPRIPPQHQERQPGIEAEMTPRPRAEDTAQPGTAYRGSDHLIDYASTKGAIVAFTRSLAQNLAQRKIRVNAVAPGPIWTPLIPASFQPEEVESFGKDVPLGRPGQPEEVAPCFVFLASDDSSYMTGQVLHPNGGEIVNG